MRQAGRYLPRYRAVRLRVSMLEAIRTPELAAEITLLPFEALDVDAAILFSDIMTPLLGMGLAFDFVDGEGPRVFNPIRSAAAIAALRTPDAWEAVPFVAEAIRLVVRELSSREIPLIGFAGAPFTLASYAIEGSHSRNYERTKGLLWEEPLLWQELMEKLVTMLSTYLTMQVEAGAAALQLFDSWAGVLSPEDYATAVAPWNRRLIQRVHQVGRVPIIYFSTGTGSYLELVASLGSDVVSVDWRVDIGKARRQIGNGRAIQGNLDPVLLQVNWSAVEVATERILAAVEGTPGHIFNLGHGILPETPVDTVRRLVDFVHERTRRGGA